MLINGILSFGVMEDIPEDLPNDHRMLGHTQR